MTHLDPKFRDGNEAVILARRAVGLTPSDPNNLGTLAAAYAEAGRFADAVETARKAADLTAQQGNPAFVEIHPAPSFGSMKTRSRFAICRSPPSPRPVAP